MTLPCYEPFDGTCQSCGNEADCKDTPIGYLCAECRALCAHCEDPMLDDSGLMHDGKLMHIACALEAMEAETPITITPMQVVRLGEMEGAA